MLEIVMKFFQSEDGAVSVDWVVLTAAIVGLAVGTIQTVGGATDDLADSVSDGVAAIEVGSTGAGSSD